MIKKFILATFLLALTIVSTASGQRDATPKKPISPELLDVKSIFGNANFHRTSWMLYAEHNDTKSAPISAENVIGDIDNYLSKAPTENKRQGEIREFNLIKKYRNNIDLAFRRLNLFGSDQLGAFFYFKGIDPPVHFGLYGDTSLSLIISGVFIGKVYNTLKLTSRQRAAKVVTTYIFPSLKAFTDNFQGEEIKYFGMTCVYGSKDFGDNSVLATKAEFVGFIAPAKLIKKYVAADLAEDELINAADVYVCDRDMGPQIKKIKVILE